MACLFGHKWDGCKCAKCGKTRDEGHDWDTGKGTCKRCGRTQPGRQNADKKQNKPEAPARTDYKPAPAAQRGNFPPYTGSGVCDVCNAPLAGKKAYIVPNPVFYRSQKYRSYVRNGVMAALMGTPMNDDYFEAQLRRDTSPGSAVCEDCIKMFP